MSARELPILMSPRMVRAILDGLKSVTRRIAKYDEHGNIKGCKYQTGDRLWVRETHCLHDGQLVYLADYYPLKPPRKWRPSIFLPRLSSRINLEVVSVHRERLRDISEADAREEGFNSREEFLTYWDKLNGKKLGYAVADNREVWVIGFKEVG